MPDHCDSGSGARNRVLLIAYLFPPSGGVGVQRAISYCRYLPENDCDVYVLTARNAAPPVFDPSLVKRVPAITRIFRAFTPEIPYSLRDRFWRRFKNSSAPAVPKGQPEPRKTMLGSLKSWVAELIPRVLFPDPQVVWTPFATRQAIKIVARHRIDTVLITAPPFSALKIAIPLRRRFPHLKIVSEFRDEWLDFYYTAMDGNRSKQRLCAAKHLEREIVQSSDYIVAVTPAQREAIRNRYPEECGGKFLCIPNGYEPDLFASQTRVSHAGDKIVVTYFGTVYPYSSPRRFLDALDGLPEEVRCRLETRFIGRVVDDELAHLKNRRTTVQYLGFMPHGKALSYLAETDYLLLCVDNKTAHAGKLFEYMAVGRPILAMSPTDGEIARVVTETGTGICIDPDDHQSVQQLFIDHHQGRPFAGERDLSSIQAYERPRLVAQLAKEIGIGVSSKDRSCPGSQS